LEVNFHLVWTGWLIPVHAALLKAAAVAGEECIESWLSSRDCLDALAKRNSQVPAGIRTPTSKPISCYSKSLKIVAAVTYPFLRSTQD
jgi:hypothetical protein